MRTQLRLLFLWAPEKAREANVINVMFKKKFPENATGFFDLISLIKARFM